MQVIGFNFTKISAQRFPTFKSGRTINNGIEFLTLDKEKVDLLKEMEAAKLSFRYTLSYSDTSESKEKDAEIVFEGVLLLSLSKEEAKDIFKSWKKKELPQIFRIPLFNLLIRKSAARALSLEEELDLPPHISIPQITPKKEDKPNSTN